MKRKILMIFMALVATISCALGLVACNGGGTENGDTGGIENSGSGSDTENSGSQNGSSGNGTENGSSGETGNLQPPHEPSEGLEYEFIENGREWLYYKNKGYDAVDLGVDGAGYAVMSIGTCTDKDLVIPSSHKGLPVICIANSKIPGNDVNAYPNVTSVYTPNCVTTIAMGAFLRCTSLTSITIPDSVTSIGREAFMGCTSLASVTIPNGVTSIGKSAFIECTSLSSVTIPNSVTSIGDIAFESCPSLESITVENGNTKYHSAGNCLIETESKTLITGCKTSIIPDDGSVTKIESNAFCECTSLTSIIIPDSITSIGDLVFSGCTSLTSVIIGNSVTSIGGYGAFMDCTSLTSITIPNGVSSIGESAFSYCSSLTSITIPNGVTYIDYQAFAHCTSLSIIDFKGTKAQWNAINKLAGWNNNTGNYTVQYIGKLDKDGNEID